MLDKSSSPLRQHLIEGHVGATQGNSGSGDAVAARGV